MCNQDIVKENSYKLLKEWQNMYKKRMIIRSFRVVVIFLTLAIPAGIITTVSASTQLQQQQNSTSNQSMMTGIDNQNITLTAVNITTEKNETFAGNIKNVSIVPGVTGLENMAYQPNTIKIKIGQTITWINNDLSIHTVTEENPSLMYL
jgi:plastocyanin